MTGLDWGQWNLENTDVFSDIGENFILMSFQNTLMTVIFIHKNLNYRPV